jgi:hypothetical protein
MDYFTNIFICAAFTAIITFTSFYEKTIEKVISKIFRREFSVLRSLFGCPLCLCMQFSFLYSFFYLGFVFKEAAVFTLIASLSSFVIYKFLDIAERL